MKNTLYLYSIYHLTSLGMRYSGNERGTGIPDITEILDRYSSDAVPSSPKPVNIIYRSITCCSESFQYLLRAYETPTEISKVVNSLRYIR